MGGYGAVNTIGGCYAFTSQHVNAISGSNDAISNDAIAGALNNCAAGRKEGEDPRWKAAVVMAPWGGQRKIFSSQSLAKIKVPTLYMSGDFDDIVGYEGVRWLFNEHKPSRALLLTYH
jgi:pimeloyl-ACP methyl ester carboxylesterase